MSELSNYCNNDVDLNSFFYTLAEKDAELAKKDAELTTTIPLLDSEEEEFLNEISEEIKKRFMNEDIEINTNEFKKSVKDIYSIIYSIIKSNSSSEQFGGVGPPYDSDIVVDAASKKIRINNQDLIAAGAFVLGLLCIVISWYKLTNILSSISSDSLSKNKIIIEEFNKYKQEVPQENLNLLGYILNVMLGGHKITEQEQLILQFLQKVVLNVLQGASEAAVKSCFSDGTTYFGVVSNLVTSIVTPQVAKDCAVYTAKEYVQNQMNMLIIQTSSQISTITNLTTFGTRITYGSIIYIGYRIRGAARIEYNGNNSKKYIEETGGYKKRSKK